MWDRVLNNIRHWSGKIKKPDMPIITNAIALQKITYPRCIDTNRKKIPIIKKNILLEIYILFRKRYFTNLFSQSLYFSLVFSFQSFPRFKGHCEASLLRADQSNATACISFHLISFFLQFFFES